MGSMRRELGHQHDPDGNHIHIDFDDAESVGIEPGVIKPFFDAGLRDDTA